MNYGVSRENLAQVKSSIHNLKQKSKYDFRR